LHHRPIYTFSQRKSKLDSSMQLPTLAAVLLGLAAAKVTANPVEMSNSHSLDARDKVKLNQYRTLDDW
jgi:hypothetical protein